MRMRAKQNQKNTTKIKLSRRLIYVGASIAMLAVVFFFAFLYLNIGITKDAKAAPTSISGVINSYLRVTAVNSGTRVFTADNLSGNSADFAVGKTVMIYQSKGATITTTNSSAYGTVTAFNNAGNYELALISAVSGGPTYTITLASLVNSYTATDLVQLVSVPIYVDADVTGTITATPWSTTTGRGGIVAFQVTRDLTLGANINVSGQGLAGGVKGGSDGTCPDNTTFTSGLTNFGAKGDGISTNGQLYARGAQLNGGGGGNPHNAGGGGGSNFSYGGNGGQGYQPGGSCTVLNAGGIGGYKINYASLTNKVFFGGGGGAGQQNDGLASNGGAGGGIILVRAQSVKSTCGGTYGFLADGQAASTITGNDGAGGGGGGGAIVLDVTNYVLTCNINVRASGGNGGSVNNSLSHGGGGGGGIGAIIEIHPTANTNVKFLSTVGTNGVDCSSCGSSTGTPAETPASPKTSISGLPGTVAALPIKLLSFTGNVIDNGVELNWVTAIEENNDYFTIERSLDGVKFDSVLYVDGAGTSKLKLKYNIIDNDAPAPAVYYRLKQTDFDKKSATSKTIFIDTHTLEHELVAIYPNPASTILSVVTTEEESALSIRISNDQGMVVYDKVSGERENKIDVQDFKEGLYIIETSVNGKRKKQKLTIKH